jgi:hypothetical protein
MVYIQVNNSFSEVESHGELKRKLPYQLKQVIILLFN